MVLSMAWMYTKTPQDETKTINLSTMVDHLANKEVKELQVDNNTMMMTAKLNDGGTVRCVYTLVDYSIISEKYIQPQVEEGTLKLKAVAPKQTPWYVSLLPTILMIAALVFFWYLIMNQQGGGKAAQFGRSKARLNKDGAQRKITFEDVAGLKEEKEELEEIVEFLRYPQRFSALGARIPKGVLLVGPPGTGKTYISRATAGEADVPFFTISGSEFVEMFVGVGASRVRDLFEQAKKNAPCIVFIDEIDAVGRQRGAGLGGGNDEREQTRNQLLVEMDGFDENSGIIILAATNRPDVLDPALLRPGRFDRQIVIGMPDIKAREEIFRVHSRNKQLAPDVKLDVLAKRTPGFSPADIENMLNEAALLTARRNGKAIRMDEIEEAITKVIAGPAKKSAVVSEKERRLTAYHEAGHAVVARSLPDSDPVHQVTIVPRGRAGGFTMTLPEEDRSYGTKKQMRNTIIHLLGGRVAEQLTMDDISTGASNDISRATDIAREMVTAYGFSDRLGPVNYSSSEEVFLGRDFSNRQNYSEEVASLIDSEIRALIEECYKECEDILTSHMTELTNVAEGLLRVETIDGAQFERLYTGEVTPDGLEEELHAKEKDIAEKNAEEAREMEAREAIAAADGFRMAMEEAGFPEDMIPDEVEIDGHRYRPDGTPIPEAEPIAPEDMPVIEVVDADYEPIPEESEENEEAEEASEEDKEGE